MIFTFISFAFCVGPIFDAPGITSSNLYSTITKPENFPLCSNFTKSKTQIWPFPSRSKDVINCISTLLETEAFENGTVRSPDGVIIETDPIIKQESPYFKDFDNVFYVSYNWVHYYTGINDTFQTLKDRIEKEVEATLNHDKAFISGYSLGGNFVRYFLTHFVDEEWKSKYIEGAMFFVPGVGGAFSSPTFVATNQFLGPKDSLTFSRHMPSLYSMFPNFPANKDVAIINGKHIDASQIFEEMIKASEFSKSEKLILKNKNLNDEAEIEIIVDETMKTLYKLHLPYLEEEIGDPNVRSLIVFNSGIPVICGVNSTQTSHNKFEYEIYNCGGDGVMPSRGAEYASQHWKNVKFHDFNTTDRKYDHSGIKFTEELKKLAKDFILNKDSSDIKISDKLKLIIFCSAAGAFVVIIIIIIIIVVVRNKKKEKNQPLSTLSKLIDN